MTDETLDHCPTCHKDAPRNRQNGPYVTARGDRVWYCPYCFQVIRRVRGDDNRQLTPVPFS